MSSWLNSDDYFVSPTLKIYKYDLSSLSLGPVEMVPPETNVTYGGPDGDDFKSFLRYNNFAVNRQGRVIVRVAQSNDRIAAGGGGYDILLLEKVVPLGKYGFTNVATTMQETLEAIRDSMKKVFVDVDLKPPAANGDPNSVLIFLKELHDVLDDRKKSHVCKSEDVKFPHHRTLKQMSKWENMVDFFCRMNRTFVNEAGTYIKFEFTGSKSGTPHWNDNYVRYYDKDCIQGDPFQMVQCDLKEGGQVVVESQVIKQGPPFPPPCYASPTCILGKDVDCAFVYREFFFFGRIKRLQDPEDTFRFNAPVTVFFEESPHAKTAYVDAQASTFFVLTTVGYQWKNLQNVEPKLLLNK